ncbi:TPA: Calcium-dependent protein kinase 15 [Trebouxia sp. C0006]
MSFLKGWFGGSEPSKPTDLQRPSQGKTSDAWRSTFSPGRNPNMRGVGRDYFDHAEDEKAPSTWQMVLKSAQVKQFQNLDANADGFIDAKDLEHHLGRSSGVAALIKEADKNNDGKIDYQEFCDLLKNQHTES